MKNLLIAVPALLVVFASCNTSTATKNSASYTVPDDSAITKAVHDAYAAISFKKGEKPRVSEIKNYFIPQAQLINFRTDTAQVTNLNQFVDLYQHFIEGNHISLFYEEELFGRTEQFGRVAHRISTYKTYLNRLDTIEEQGVNSFQLIKTKDGWKVSSIIWDVEKPALKIPEYYLKK
ncbi:MAG TPA: hypothetical protein VFE53_01190 [Mucilaginibacter sp.]|jgi:hypothetical protein|nr:hypothetical protein [Mucilaginibacter sp.]